MPLSSGTPLWASLLLSFGAVSATHFLTLRRERTKRERDDIADWRRRAGTQLHGLVDSARAHFTDPTAVAQTPRSAQNLVVELKRFSAVMLEVKGETGDASKRTMDLLTELNTTITGPDDFQDTSRVARAADDEIVGKILDVEDAIRRDIAQPRKTMR